MQAAEMTPDSTVRMTLDNVTAGYDGHAQIRNVTLEVGSGDFVGVTGPNGGGKTTLMRVMLGLLKPMHGSVAYYHDGHATKQLRMGYLPQYNAIDKDFPINVEQTVLSGLDAEAGLFGRIPQRLRDHAAELMCEMELEGMGQRPIKALSGGELQRVLLARATVRQPEVLILDEPDTYIDRHSEQLMHDILRSMASKCCIIMVSHDKALVDSLANVTVSVDETVATMRRDTQRTR
jgi:zinc transport system ATP-binding protein